MNQIAQRLSAIKSTLPCGVELVAVSKFHPVEALQQAYDAGQRVFGESRVQELTAKMPQLPDDIAWHFIGHLQTNKVKPLIGRVALIESVDSERLLQRIDDLSAQAGVETRVLMQLHVAQEETKFGFSPDELIQFFADRKHLALKATKIVGVMGMASNTDDIERIKADFQLIAATHRRIADDTALSLEDFDIVSMGMSGDYPLAIDAGANLVRVGSAIFGDRGY